MLPLVMTVAGLEELLCVGIEPFWKPGGVIQDKLIAVVSKRTKVKPRSRIVPPNHKINSIRPGCNNHQRR